MPDDDIGKAGELVLSLGVDAVGLFSYFIPGVGEFLDIGTAPLNYFYILELLDTERTRKLQQVIATIGFVEEAAPFIDIIPTATIAWIYKWYIA